MSRAQQPRRGARKPTTPSKNKEGLTAPLLMKRQKEPKPKPRWPTWRAWMALGIASGFYLIDVFGRLSVGVVTTTLQREFHLTADEVSVWYGSSFYYAYAAMQLPWGVMMDKIGPKFCISAAAMLAAGGTFLTGVAPSLSVGAFARILTGIGCAGAWMGVVKVIRVEFRRFPRLSGAVFGLSTCLGGIGALGSQAPFGALVDAFDWRVAFELSALAPLLLAVLACVFVRNQAPKKRRRKGAAGATGMPRNTSFASASSLVSGEWDRQSYSSLEGPRVAPGTATTLSNAEAGLAQPSSANGAKGGSGSKPNGRPVPVRPQRLPDRRGRPQPRRPGYQSNPTTVVAPKEQLSVRARAVVACRTIGMLMKKPRLWLMGLYCGLTDAPWETFAGLWGVAGLEQAVGWSANRATFWTSANVIAATVSMVCTGPVLALTSTRGQHIWCMITVALIGALGYVPLVLQGWADVPDESIMAGIVAVGLSVMSAPLLWELIAADPLCEGHAGLVSGLANMCTIVVDAVTQQLAGGVLSAMWSGGFGEGAVRVYSPKAFGAMFGCLGVEFLLAAVVAASLGLPALTPPDKASKRPVSPVVEQLGGKRRRSSVTSVGGPGLVDWDEILDSSSSDEDDEDGASDSHSVPSLRGR